MDVNDGGIGVGGNDDGSDVDNTFMMFVVAMKVVVMVIKVLH